MILHQIAQKLAQNGERVSTVCIVYDDALYSNEVFTNSSDACFVLIQGVLPLLNVFFQFLRFVYCNNTHLCIHVQAENRTNRNRVIVVREKTDFFTNMTEAQKAIEKVCQQQGRLAMAGL